MRYGQQSHVVARDPKARMILLGGLGALGVGQMWFVEDAAHRGYPGYDDAAIADVRTDATGMP